MSLAAVLVASLTLLQQNPVFRSQANAAAVDVIVTDKNGRVVTSLTAADFIVTSNRKPRAVVTAEFIGTRPASLAGPVTMPEPDLAASAASTNRGRDQYGATSKGPIRPEGRTVA